MNLLLTSGGLTNKILKEEFLKLVNKSASEISVAFITTAAKAEKDTSYLEEDLNDLREIGIKKIKQIDISDPKVNWERTLIDSDVIWIEGGNTFYLLQELKKAGLDKNLNNYLGDKVFVGVSAGSIVVTPDISIASVPPGDSNDVGMEEFKGLGWVDFEVSPHTINYVPLDNVERYAKNLERKLYAYDDNSAVLVKDNEVRVIGGGFYKIFN